MFSKHFINDAQSAFQARLPYLGRRRERIERELAGCGENEQILMKFLYGTMPLRDAGEYDFSVFYSFAVHGLFLAEEMPWCQEIPEEIFLHYVLYYRVNTEAIEDCRSFFYEKLFSRIKGLTAREAVLEINYWCAENGSYEASDCRTISPMTMYRSGKGRCGEESVFAVTAFRSVGIPARQVYTPRWAHCDDNHAWVEVYIDGAWHFLGACEPEEVLDRGWFSHASSRALFVHTLTFSEVASPLRHFPREEDAGREGQVVYYNQTSFYARTRKLKIFVQDENECPVEKAMVCVEILNMAEFSPAVSLLTGEDGRAEITLGFGSVHLRAEKDGCWTDELLSAADAGKVILQLPSRPEESLPVSGDGRQTGWEEFYLTAPDDFPMHRITLTKEQKQQNRKRLMLARSMREKRIEGYFQEELAKNYPCETELFRLSAGNFHEIYSFLSQDESADRRALLHHLSVKDLKDVRAELLNRHLEKASCFRELWEKLEKREIYVRYLLNPRIDLEELTDYRTYIQAYFTAEEKQGFFQNPETIWDYIQKHIHNHQDMDYASLCSSPIGCLELSHGNAHSQKILFVAICRTLGIPARLHPVNAEAQWYHQNGFISIPSARQEIPFRPAVLTLCSDGKSDWQYYQHWTIGRLEKSRWITLDYTGKRIAGGKGEFFLAPGTYRLLTANRLPNGNQTAAQIVFSLTSGQKKEIFMHQTAGDTKYGCVRYQLEDFEVRTEEDRPLCCISRLIKRDTALLLFLQEGEEPTEHVLNELFEQGEALFAQNVQILFILQGSKSLDNATLLRVRKHLPQIDIVYGDFDEIAEPIARRMYVEPEQFPLLVLVRPGLEAFYGSCGYRVGIIDLLLQLVKDVVKCEERISED